MNSSRREIIVWERPKTLSDGGREADGHDGASASADPLTAVITGGNINPTLEDLMFFDSVVELELVYLLFEESPEVSLSFRCKDMGLKNGMAFFSFIGPSVHSGPMAVIDRTRGSGSNPVRNGVVFWIFV